EAVDLLTEQGVLRNPAGGYQVTLAPDLEARAGQITASLDEAGARDLWLAALEPEGEEACLPAFRAWLLERLRASERPGIWLPLLLSGADASEAAALSQPLVERDDWSAGRALELLRARPDLEPFPEVVALLRRADYHEQQFAPFQACAYLI